ncbi:MAG: winged helix-turn-helix domain-containing protein [Dysgonamonadaceae bacterium]
MKEKIGENAGKVWAVLNEVGNSNLKDVKKATKLTEKDLYAALGWLAREEKIVFEEADKEIFVALA